VLRRLTRIWQWRAAALLAAAYALSTIAPPTALALMEAATAAGVMAWGHPAATKMHNHHGKAHDGKAHVHHVHPDGTVHHHGAETDAGLAAASDEPSNPCCGLLSVVGVPPYEGPVLGDSTRICRAPSVRDDRLVGCGPGGLDHPPTILLS
jgi:hypothetical protein